MTSFRQVVDRALDRVWPDEADQEGFSTAEFAVALRDGLKAAGYSIHRSGECVHPRTRRGDLGRPMTAPEAGVLLCGAPNPEQSGEFCVDPKEHAQPDVHTYAQLAYAAEPAP